MGNQGSTVYLVIQLSVVSCQGYGQITVLYQLSFYVGLWSQLLEPCSSSWFSARSVRLWYRACMVLFHNISTTLTCSYDSDNICLIRLNILFHWSGVDELVRFVRTRSFSLPILVFMSSFYSCGLYSFLDSIYIKPIVISFLIHHVWTSICVIVVIRIYYSLFFCSLFGLLNA